MTAFSDERSVYEAERVRLRRRLLLAGGALLALFLLFLSLGSTSIRLISPAQTAHNLWLGARLTLAKYLNGSLYGQRLRLIQAAPSYLETMTRLQGGLTSMAAGAMLAAAGTALQCVFRNPIAGPGLLGISSGIRAGNLLLVLQYSTLAVSMTARRFLCGYACSAGLLLLIFLTGWIAGRGKGSVTDMLLTGCVLSRVVSRVVSGLQYRYLDESEYLVLQEMDLYGAGGPQGNVLFAAALLAGMLPLLLWSNGLNLTVFSDEEARTMGRNVSWLRLLALLCATALAAAAQIRCGDLGMLALLVPQLCRYLFGPDTRRLMAGSVLLGAGVLLACRFITALLAFHPYLWAVSSSMLVDLFAMPVMLLVIWKYRRGWN